MRNVFRNKFVFLLMEERKLARNLKAVEGHNNKCQKMSSDIIFFYFSSFYKHVILLLEVKKYDFLRRRN